jgi:hypothetical protein
MDDLEQLRVRVRELDEASNLRRVRHKKGCG